MGPKSHLDQQLRKFWPWPQLLAKRLNTTRIGPQFPAREEKLVWGLWSLLVTWGLQVETTILTLFTCSPRIFGELGALLAPAFAPAQACLPAAGSSPLYRAPAGLRPSLSIASSPVMMDY